MTGQRPATDEASRKLYVNTLIFSIAAGIVTFLLLLALIFVPSVRAFAIGIATLEVGLVTLIIVSIVRIHNYEKQLAADKQFAAKQVVTLDTCPDYFTSTYKAAAGSKPAGAYCSNGYSNPDGNQKYYFVGKTCTPGNEIEDPTCALRTGTNLSNPAQYNFSLSDYDRKTSTELCQSINTRSSESEFASVPWTEVKMRCNSLSIGA